MHSSLKHFWIPMFGLLGSALAFIVTGGVVWVARLLGRFQAQQPAATNVNFKEVAPGESPAKPGSRSAERLSGAGHLSLASSSLGHAPVQGLTVRLRFGIHEYLGLPHFVSLHGYSCEC